MGGSSGSVPTGPVVEDEYATVRTSVWWDIENCQVPKACDPHLIAQNISSALAEMGYRGPVSISAFGDTSKIAQPAVQALNSTGIALNHVPAGVKDASDKKILVDMLLWAVDNPPPANYLLISGDRDFSNALHQLSFRRYNILLAQPPNVSQALVAAAKNVWNWKDLVVGGPPLAVLPVIEDTANGYSANAKVDNRTKGKQRKQSNPIQSTSGKASTPCTVNQPLASQALPAHVSSQQFSNNIKNPEQLSPSTIPSSEFQDRLQAKNTSLFPQSSIPKQPSQPSEAMPFKVTPHEFFQGNWPNSSSGHVANYAASKPDFALEHGNTFPSNHKSHQPQLLKPSDLLPPQPNSQPGHSSSTKSPNYNYATYSNKQNMSSFPVQNGTWTSEHMHRPPAPPLPTLPPIRDKCMSQDGLPNTGCPVPTSEVQNILNALHILKANKMIPTEANIVDCIRYGEMSFPNFDIKAALDYAIQHKHVVKHMLGGNLTLYVGKNIALWKWVNTMDVHAKHPQATWDAVLKFLSSVEGHHSVMTSPSRYRAATCIRESCLNHLALGEVLQILQAITDVKKWIMPHRSGWQPLSFSLPDTEKKANTGVTGKS
ncbi:meiosis regulator and mRNA stability factor 1-like isoform X1 [Zingiber officinale]|uniref:meiosis regulator and mRNA stability factor 1-like isoform X1 n=1 Tax=Zingiber officinale TaxID=94328 RepID=UPI001C4A7DBB|nr:meiosis regulator and mRNA stability factor 1-like isoform X1 [Zingiber officinale]